jgi:hypothetical protein
MIRAAVTMQHHLKRGQLIGDSMFDTAERALLASLADELIPGDGQHLSASAADVAGTWLDHVLAARPDLVEGLRDVLRRAQGREPKEFVAELRVTDAAAFGVLAEVVPGAYFMNPQVQQAIGYFGQTPRPIDPHPDYLDDGLLESVLRRGPIYRPTPQQ